METSDNTSAILGFPGVEGGGLPPLAQYRPRSEYVPQYGDYIVWSRWFSCWHGIVKYYDNHVEDIHVIFAGVPFLLFTMTEQQQEKETVRIQLSKLRGSRNGEYAILRHDPKANANIWYI